MIKTSDLVHRSIICPEHGLQDGLTFCPDCLADQASAKEEGKPCIKTQIKQWGVAEGDFLAPEIGIVESFLGSPFSTPAEDEAFDAIAAKQQGCSVCGCKNEQIENQKLRAQIQSLRDYCDKLLVGELKR